jgi:hypothetical protein
MIFERRNHDLIVKKNVFFEKKSNSTPQAMPRAFSISMQTQTNAIQNFHENMISLAGG